MNADDVVPFTRCRSSTRSSPRNPGHAHDPNELLCTLHRMKRSEKTEQAILVDTLGQLIVVCTEYSNRNILVMKAAENSLCRNFPELLNRTKAWSIFV